MKTFRSVYLTIIALLGTRFTFFAKKNIFIEDSSIQNLTYVNVILSKRVKDRLFTLLGLISAKSTLSQQQRIGFLYFVTLVFEADHILDNSMKRKKKLTERQLRNYLKKQTILPLYITLDKFQKLMLKHFPYSKRSQIIIFLKKMIRLHTKIKYPRIGEYSFDDVMEYRHQTNDSLTRTIGMLIEFNKIEILLEKISLGIIIQYSDDFKDVYEDWENESFNLFLGLANDKNELTEIINYFETSNSIPSKKEIKESIQKLAPNTYNTYKHFLNIEIRKLKPSFWKFFFKVRYSITI